MQMSKNYLYKDTPILREKIHNYFRFSRLSSVHALALWVILSIIIQHYLL